MATLQELRTNLQESGFVPLIKDTTPEDAYEYFRDFSDENRPDYKVRITVDVGVIHPINPESKPEITIKKIYENGQESETANVCIDNVNIFDENRCGVNVWKMMIENFLKVQNQ
jgi:hypothetical protein